jgi:hypothetical protein
MIEGAEVVVFQDVLFMSNGPMPICEYRGERVGVPSRLMEPGTMIRTPGDRGTLVLACAAAESLGLL